MKNALPTLTPTELAGFAITSKTLFNYIERLSTFKLDHTYYTTVYVLFLMWQYTLHSYDKMLLQRFIDIYQQSLVHGKIDSVYLNKILDKCDLTNMRPWDIKVVRWLCLLGDPTDVSHRLSTMAVYVIERYTKKCPIYEDYYILVDKQIEGYGRHITDEFRLAVFGNTIPSLHVLRRCYLRSERYVTDEEIWPLYSYLTKTRYTEQYIYWLIKNCVYTPVRPWEMADFTDNLLKFHDLLESMLRQMNTPYCDFNETVPRYEPTYDVDKAGNWSLVY